MVSLNITCTNDKPKTSTEKGNPSLWSRVAQEKPGWFYYNFISPFLACQEKAMYIHLAKECMSGCKIKLQTCCYCLVVCQGSTPLGG